MCALAILALGVIGYASVDIQAKSNAFRVRDALMTAAPIVLGRCREPSPRDPRDQLDDVSSMHHTGSVSPTWFDDAGKPVDAWGTRFRITVDKTRPPEWVICESAGPDRDFGTPDDISERAGG